jgi:hypothetical protein
MKVADRASLRAGLTAAVNSENSNAAAVMAMVFMLGPRFMMCPGQLPAGGPE